MENTTVTKAASLVGEIKAIEGESEEAFLSLGALFPEFSAKMDASLRGATRSLQSLEALSDGYGDMDRRTEAITRAAKARLESNRALFSLFAESDTALLAEIERSVEKLSGLDDIIAEVREDSEEMEIVSINALTVALKSGAAGKAFSVITDELKRLSGRTIALTVSLSRLGKDLLERFRAFGERVREVRNVHDEFFEAMSTGLARGFALLEAQVRSVAVFFRQQCVHSEAMGQSVTRIMQNVQHQDIIRQSLQHVSLALEEASTIADRAERDAFLFKAVRLSLVVLDDISARLGGTAREFCEKVSELDVLSRGCEERRAGFLELLSAGSGEERRDAGERSARYLADKRAFIRDCRSLEARVRELDEGLKALVKLMSRFKNVVTASRMEIAKNKSLGQVNTTVRGMMELTERIEADVSVAIGQTGAFMKIATRAIDGYARDFESRETELAAMLEGIDSDFSSLDDVRSRAADYVRGFALFSGEFVDLVDKARKELESFDGLSARLSAVGDGMRGMMRSVSAKDESGLSDTRLRRLIDRFTIFTHKKAAGEVANVGELSAEAADAGEVTLF